MATYETVMQGWAERSGEIRFSEYMDGVMIPRGLDARSAAIAIKLAFPAETHPRTPNDIADQLNAMANVEYDRIANEFYNPKKVYG